MEFLFHGIKESCNFENLLHAFDNTQKNQLNFQKCVGKMKKWSEKKIVKND